MSYLQLQLFDIIKSKVQSLKPRVKRRPSSSTKSRRPRKSKFVDDPFLKNLWVEIRKDYFPDRPELDDYVVYWSKRNQIRTLASCNIEGKRISVAKELNHTSHFGWLSPLLYHEMCHAYLEYNVSETNGRRAWHGKEFKALERRHPQVRELDKWIKSGGWLTAVRSHRARAAHARRKQEAAA